jgi:hypothetical protein
MHLIEYLYVVIIQDISKMRLLILTRSKQSLLNETFFSIWIFYEKNVYILEDFCEFCKML